VRFYPGVALRLTCLVLGLLSLSPARGHAESDAASVDSEDSPRCEAERHVVLSLANDLEPELQREIFADLASELAPRGLTVCMIEAREPGTALADVRVARREGARLSIEVFDRTTDKRVSRDVSLSRIPNNARALAIAIAIDELLRASWAELALRVRPGPPPPAATEAPQNKTPQRKPTRGATRLGLEATYLGSTNQFDALGGALTLETSILSNGWIEGRTGLSRALTRKVPDGELSVWSGQAGLTLGACFALGASGTRACLGARSELEVLRFRGTSDGSAVGKSQTRPIVLEAFVTKLSVPLRGPWSLCLSSGAAVTLLGARVTDGARTLTRIEGVLLLGGLGIGASL